MSVNEITKLAVSVLAFQ